MGDLTSFLRLFELSGAGGVLIIGFVFMIRWLVPRIVRSFEDGMKSIASEIQKVNTEIKAVHKCLKTTNTTLADLIRQEMRHTYERLEDQTQASDQISNAQAAEISRHLQEMSSKIDNLLQQLK